MSIVSVACRCVQECKKNILFRACNPQFDRMGDNYWKPDLIASIWKQAETGSIPVSGAGYRGPFAAPGFDEMWTDMSEIVRPTRDGIHGREYISTLIELGRRPQRLEFDEKRQLLTKMYPFIEIPIPIVLDIPQRSFVTKSTKLAIAQAAGTLQTFTVASYEDATRGLSGHRDHLIVKLYPDHDNSIRLKDIAIVELAYSEHVTKDIELVKASNASVIISIRIPLDEYAPERAAKLSADCAKSCTFKPTIEGRVLESEVKSLLQNWLKRFTLSF